MSNFISQVLSSLGTLSSFGKYMSFAYESMVNVSLIKPGFAVVVSCHIGHMFFPPRNTWVEVDPHSVMLDYENGGGHHHMSNEPEDSIIIAELEVDHIEDTE